MKARSYFFLVNYFIKPIYAPENLQHLINLGNINQVKLILQNLKETGRLSPERINNLFYKTFKEKPVELLEFTVPPVSKLMSNEKIGKL